MRWIYRMLALTGLMLTSPLAAAPPSFSGLYVFGDSLVDSGNAFLSTGGAVASPANGYFLGRFSNGPNFADGLSLTLRGTLADPALAGGRNFAVGGATAAFIPGATSPSFLEQIGLFNSIGGGAIPNDALVLITFGGNDVRRTITTAGAVDFTSSGTALANGLGLLHAAGGRNFLITGSPDIGNLPSAIAAVGGIPGRLGELTMRSQQISALFAGTSSAFAATTGAKVTFFDIFSFEQQVRADPTAFGLPADLNLTDPCQIIGGGFPQFANCSSHVYFDGIHPTTLIHAALTDAMLAQLEEGAAPIPEPETWIMLLFGFAVVGAGVRARRGRTALPA